MSDDLLKRVLAEAWLLIKPAVDALADDGLREALLARAGVRALPSPGAPDAGTIASLEAYLRKDATGITEFVEVCQTALPIARAVKALFNAAKTESGGVIADQLTQQVLQLLTLPYVRARAPWLWAIFRIVGIANDNVTTHYGDELDLERWKHFLTDGFAAPVPLATEDDARAASLRFFLPLSIAFGTLHKKNILNVVQAYYGWEPPPDSTATRADAIAERTLTIALRDATGSNPEPSFTLGLAFVPVVHGGPALFLLPSFTDNLTLPLGAGWTLSTTLGFPGPGVAIPLGSGVSSTSPGSAGTEALLSIGVEREAPWAWHISDQVTFSGKVVQVGADLSRARIGGRLLLRDLQLEVKKGAGDGLLQKLIGDGFAVTGKVGVVVLRDSDGTIGFDLEGGIGFKKNSPRKATQPVGKSIGGVRLENFSFDLGTVDDARGKGLVVTVGVRISARLGPLTAILDGPSAGIDAYYSLKDASATPNLLGLLDVGNFELRPPTSLALALDAGAVQGGGMIDYDPAAHQYAGAISLQVRGKWGIDAVGLITTQPFSLLLLGDARFPAIPIGFGFSLAGLGVLFGYDRRADVDALSAALQAGNLDALMFPSDPASKPLLVANTLATLFPQQSGACTIGLLARIVWGPGDLAHVDLGFVYDTSAPKRLIAVGRVEVARPMVQLKLLVLGVLDFDQGELDLQARLFDSHILGVDLAGDAAVMLRWGDQPCFVLSIGGFHPAFTPPTRFTTRFPALKRVSMRLHTDESVLRIKFEAYFAVTSNSLQLGARVDLWAGVAGFSAEGMLAFDALVIWDPRFWVDVSIEGGVALKVDGVTLLGAHVKAELTGPDPWIARGTASVDVLWWTVDFSFGPDSLPAAPTLPVVDGVKALGDALAEPRNWGALPPDAALVSVARPPASAGLVLHPLDSLAVRQPALPLDRAIDRVPSGPLDGWRRFSLAQVRVGAGGAASLSELDDDFAPAQYAAMTDAEKLSSPSFQRMSCGASATPAAAALIPASASTSWSYDEVVWTPTATVLRPAVVFIPTPATVAVALSTGAAAEAPLRRTGLAKYARAPIHAV